MVKHVFVAVLMWLALALLRVPVILLGLLVVPAALPFRRELASNREGLYWPGWKLVRLPWWAWPWDNLRDGCMGDVRGDYWFREYHGFLDWLPNKWVPFAKMAWWLAIRNPANNFSRFMRPNAVDVRTLKISLLAGHWGVDKTMHTSWQFVMGQGAAFRYYGFYCLIPFRGGHINIRVGHKIEPKHYLQDFSGDPQKAIKGFTFRLLWDR